MASIIDDEEEHEFVLGSSFSKNSGSAFYSTRYDFKPASLDNDTPSNVEIKENNEVIISVPHTDAVSETVFRGNKRPASKECLLIIDHETGKIRLEKLSATIQLKKSREGVKREVSTTSAAPSLATSEEVKVEHPIITTVKKEAASPVKVDTSSRTEVQQPPRKPRSRSAAADKLLRMANKPSKLEQMFDSASSSPLPPVAKKSKSVASSSTNKPKRTSPILAIPKSAMNSNELDAAALLLEASLTPIDSPVSSLAKSSAGSSEPSSSRSDTPTDLNVLSADLELSESDSSSDSD